MQSNENEVNVSIDKVIIKGGHDTPPKKKKKKQDDPTMIPMNESDVGDLDYLTEG